MISSMIELNILNSVENKMNKAKSQALNELTALYESSRDGQAAVEKACRTAKYKGMVNYRKCGPCESEEPHIDNVCCVCSTAND